MLRDITPNIAEIMNFDLWDEGQDQILYTTLIAPKALITDCSGAEPYSSEEFISLNFDLPEEGHDSNIIHTVNSPESIDHIFFRYWTL